MGRPEGQEIVERLRGAADYRREFGPIEGVDIYERAAEAIEEARAERDRYREALARLVDALVVDDTWPPYQNAKRVLARGGE